MLIVFGAGSPRDAAALRWLELHASSRDGLHSAPHRHRTDCIRGRRGLSYRREYTVIAMR
jgi:hypothetical protein